MRAERDRLAMGYPRIHTVDPTVSGFFHCVSRCVRRAWLCGEDPVSGRCFDHRRAWVEHRLIHLAESFAVGLYAWAVMSNHTHVVLRVDPTAADRWTDEEVAHRWARLTRRLEPLSEEEVRSRIAQVLGSPGRVDVLRERLGSLSWFMRFLNESIARAANAEDGCTGRFWEGRFKCQALLDEDAVLAAMTYADLNPIRSGLADELMDSDFTSIQRRLLALREDAALVDASLVPMCGLPEGVGPALTVGAYVELVEWRGRQAREGKSGRIDADAPSALECIRGSRQAWCQWAVYLERGFAGAVGTPERLRQHAEAMGRRWVWGWRAGAGL